MKQKSIKTLFKFMTALGVTLSTSMGMAQEQMNYQSNYWMQSETPLLGQLIPVNQINLQKGVHLFDVETMGKSWQGITNPFDTMGLGSFDSNNHEALIRLRYAYPLTRYTYIGLTAGFASRWEAELYDETGMIDPEIFIGHHLPWRNGNLRLGLAFSPSLGASEMERNIELDDESAKGNFYRGGWSVRPEVSLTLRTGKVLFGAEASYLYFGERTQNEYVAVSPEALQDPGIQAGLQHQYLGMDQSSYMPNGAGGYYTDLSPFQYGEEIQSKITGGHVWAVKGILEIPDWQRVGAEVIYGQMDTSLRENNLGKQVENEGGAFQEVRVYGRYRYSDQMSFTPLVSWMPELPPVRGQDRLDSTSDVWGVQLTFRTKFQL